MVQLASGSVVSSFMCSCNHSTVTVALAFTSYDSR